MRLTFIGSGIERETTRLAGIEVQAVAIAARARFDTLLFGGSSVGLMEAFAAAFDSAGGRVISVVPPWLEQHGLVYAGADPVLCADLAERKRLMFEETDAILVYPGGIGTWDELFDLLARRAAEPKPPCPPVYVYNWELYYAPLLLQIETAVAVGLIHPCHVSTVTTFATVDRFVQLLDRDWQTA